MFDFINKYKKYDAEKIQKRLAARKKVKTVSSSHLSVVKKYLKEKLLECLRILSSNKGRPFEPHVSTFNVDILVERGLYHLAEKELNQAKEAYFQHSFPIEQLMLLRRESLLGFYTRYENATPQSIEALCEAREKTARELQLEIRMANALTMLSYIQMTGEKDMDSVRKYVADDYFPENFEALSFAPRYLFYWTKALIARHEGQNEAALSYFAKAVQTWRDYPAFIEAYPKMYLGTCFTYLDFYQTAGGDHPDLFDDRDFEALLDQLPKANLTPALENQYRRLFLINRVDALVKSLQFDNGLALEPQVLQIIRETKDLTSYERMFFSIFMGYAYFFKGHYPKVLEWLDPVMEAKDLKRKEYPSYTSRSVLLYLMTHYEMKNFRFLKRELRRLKNFLIQHDSFNEFEALFFKMFSHLLSSRYEDKKELVFRNWKKQLTAIAATGPNAQTCNANHLNLWIDKHLYLLEQEPKTRKVS
ncbi:MAG: hypothetical protein D6714_17165 [Bacteroidetes bacterium]|nr:MAG: hypothetical protein D6714_17165 [Bacteroidota bacterium]